MRSKEDMKKRMDEINKLPTYRERRDARLKLLEEMENAGAW